MSIALVLAAAAAQAAQPDPLAPLAEPLVTVQTGPKTKTPAQPTPVTIVPPPASSPTPVIVQPVRVPQNWREVFLAIRGGRWAEARAGIAALPPSVLTPVVKAELYTAKGSPTVSLEQIQALLAEAPDLPQAEQLARLATVRGAVTPVSYVGRRPMTWLGNAPSRTRATPVRGEPAADDLRAKLDPLIRADDAANAELLVVSQAPYLSYEARAEAGQRVAWSYYSLNRDPDARRVADTYRQGATGDWAVQSAWISGLASWRMNDCESASRAFREVAMRAAQREMSAAGYYWAARAEQACRRPGSVAPLLKQAARSTESFYGLLARETLGTEKRLPEDRLGGLQAVRSIPNVRRAEELVAIGQPWLAEDFLEHQAQIGRASEHHGLIEAAKSLNLPSAQYWLAHNGQPGAVVDAVDRYPMPGWTPVRGWRIDPALALAHIRQESSFRLSAVSGAGAVGLMQVRPGTASDMARAAGMAYSETSLTDPRYNMEFGQSFIERIRGMSATQGQLPKVIAAYNAGPLPVARWSSTLATGDPLLWIESIPYWETRYYVPAVLRNMWVYQGMAGSQMPTLNALAQHRWPAFPTAHTNFAAASSVDVGGGTTP